MIIPKKFHYCGVDYVVEEIDRLDGTINWGRTQYDSGKIYLEKNIHRQKKEQTFVHELIHVALQNTGLRGRLSRDEEESLVESFANNVYGILKDSGVINDN